MNLNFATLCIPKSFICNARFAFACPGVWSCPSPHEKGVCFPTQGGVLLSPPLRTEAPDAPLQLWAAVTAIPPQAEQQSGARGCFPAIPLRTAARCQADLKSRRREAMPKCGQWETASHERDGGAGPALPAAWRGETSTWPSSERPEATAGDRLNNATEEGKISAT